ncbi:MAG TPA: MarR family transcriptional regulator [Tahibacter sp.]|uniref:MarR family winged helix-turn-helix transcriptional regulator n=1 Tax=Tahibacter sp. TaxID=2056211 RepID=UPI002C5846E6|nr:MarR family transcriptional regulator [Tahibacter sp.]HSX62591.1 MarR family transcriptional regulator [Tahibacter sp.]
MQRISTGTESLPAAVLADAAALHAAVSDLVRIYQFRDRDKICCYDISVTQCYALEALAEHGPMRSQALAERLLLDKSTTTRVVDALVRKGYAERKPDAVDARALSLEITRAGQSLYETISRELVAQQAAIVAALDPAVRATVIDVIRRLARTAQARFVSGVSVGDCSTGSACGPGGCG